jgi:IclR family transcriptional regulator, KDG regulon repressor
MGQKRIQSLEKGLDLLFLFTEEKPALSVEEISARSGLPKSTCYRFLNTFKQKNIMELNGTSGKYCLGVGLLKLESVVHSSLSIARIAIPYLQNLSDISGETAQLVVLHKNEGVCVERVESTAALRVMPDKGNTIYLHSGASGKVILAHLPPEERGRIIREKGLKRLTASTITDPTILQKELGQICRRGYAVSDQEIYQGVKAIAAPIFDFQGKIAASVGVAGPRERMTAKRASFLIPCIKEAANEISIRLGANPQ